MRLLPHPSDENGHTLDQDIVYSKCVSAIKDERLRSKMNGIHSHVSAATAEYLSKASSQKMYELQPHKGVNGVSGKDLVSMFDRLRRSKDGRPYYLKIREIPKYGKCPYCDIGVVQSLDHYLPKEKFPVYSVAPFNLVASCSWCQTEKGTYSPNSEGEQILHPYFDDLNAEIWLQAKIVQDVNVGFQYFSSPPTQWTEELKERTWTHLSRLNLFSLYSHNAGSRITEIRHNLNTIHSLGGQDAVKEHLTEDLASREAEHLNSWVSAMYRATTDSDWFCDGGFNYF